MFIENHAKSLYTKTLERRQQCTVGPFIAGISICNIDISIEHKQTNILSPSGPLCDHRIMYQTGLKDRLQKWPQMAQNTTKKRCFQYLIFKWLDEGHKCDLDGQIIDML